MSASQKKNEDNVFRVTMFGSFDIEYNGKHMVQNIGRSKKLNILLAFLLYNKGKIVSQNDIINHIWPEGNSLDPVNALKNLVYRLRKVLVKESGFPNLEYIVFSKNTYYWNVDIKTELDVEEFVQCIKSANLPSVSEPDKSKYLNRAVELYKGEFLSALVSEDWVIPLTTYYFNLFLSCVDSLTEINEKEKKYNENIDLCYKALSYDQFEEKVHLCLIKTFVKNGLINKAISHYDYLANMFYKELGVLPSEELKLAYKNIITKTDFEESDLETIKNELRETMKIEGAYFCDYDAFKHIYRIESRSLSRNGQAIFVCLVTLTSMVSDTDSKTNFKAVKLLGEHILLCLRSGDVFSKYSQSQYVIMLKSITFENGETVLKRIINTFLKESVAKNFKVTYKLQSLDPTEH